MSLGPPQKTGNKIQDAFNQEVYRLLKNTNSGLSDIERAFITAPTVSTTIPEESESKDVETTLLMGHTLNAQEVRDNANAINDIEVAMIMGVI